MHAKSLAHKAASLVASVSLVASMVPSAAFATTTPTNVTYGFYDNKVSENTAHQIQFTAAAVIPSGGTITITLPAGFVIGTLSTDNDIEVSGTGVSTTLASVSKSGQVITATTASDDIEIGDQVSLNIGTDADKIANPGSVGSYPILIETSAGDSVTVSVAIVDDGDIAVSASVVGSMTLTVADNVADLGTLSPTAIKTVTNVNQVSVGSNAPEGFELIPLGLTTLTNGGDTIPFYDEQTVGTAGTAGWGIKFTEVSDSGTNATIDTTYDDAGSYRLPSYESSVPAVTASGITSAVYSVVYGANISSSTPAGTYAGEVRYIMYGRF